MGVWFHSGAGIEGLPGRAAKFQVVGAIEQRWRRVGY